MFKILGDLVRQVETDGNDKKFIFVLILYVVLPAIISIACLWILINVFGVN